MIDFTGKNVIVTGGSRGIGAAAVNLFMNAGANVSFNYRKNLRAAEALVEKCSHSIGKLHFEECDVSRYSDVEKFINNTIHKLGNIDILVNNAGIWEYGAIDTMTVDEWRRTMQTNLDSIYFFSHLVVKHMKEKSVNGSIVNIASTAGQRGEAFHSHYAASKGAIISFTKSLATELGPNHIRVNCVAPGWVKTDMSEEAIASGGRAITKDIPMGFIPESEDIAWPILFLASDQARAINGEILNVNGGSVLCG